MERLQKVMARAGIGSRRRCEELIAAGEVRVNGRVVSLLGSKVDISHDIITVSGGKLPRSAQKHYFVLYKPRGYVCTVRDERGRKSVLELLTGVKERVYPVGRLDYASEGLLLLTNDGDLTYALTHPKHRVPKTYTVRVEGHPAENKLDRLAKGVPLQEGLTAPAKVRLLERAEDKSLLEITLYEGRNRQIRHISLMVLLML